MKIRRDISQEKLLKILGLKQDTMVYCCCKEEISVSKLQEGDYIVCRYKRSYIYCFEVFKVTERAGEKILVDSNPYGPEYIVLSGKPSIFSDYNVCTSVHYYLDGRSHRALLPATIYYDENDLVVKEMYCVHGKTHNSVGPAIREFSNGSWHSKFFLYGKSVDKDRFFNILDKRAA